MIIPRAAVDLRAVAAHYDDLDELYRRLWGTSLHHGYWITGKESPDEAVDNLTRLVAARAELKRGASVCDLGCGYGTVALALSREFGAKVTGLTVSEKQYSHARTLADDRGRMEFYLRDALDSGLPSGSYDAVIAIESTEHIGDKTKLLTEAARLMRPGGRCVVAAWLSREHPSARETKYLLEPICVEGRLPSMASELEFLAMFADAGLREVKFLDLTRNVKKTWAICARRVAGQFLTDKSFRRQLTDRQFGNRVFAKTVFRICLAYRLGSMRYGIFSARK
jgi:cyclopropane fatty-acyl-phospholipid synthase-like methyltransferase